MNDLSLPTIAGVSRLVMQSAGDALAFGEMGIGNTSSAALLAYKLTGELS
jgi:NaMN:DMB phosphoribosyltransferase